MDPMPIPPRNPARKWAKGLSILLVLGGSLPVVLLASQMCWYATTDTWNITVGSKEYTCADVPLCRSMTSSSGKCKDTTTKVTCTCTAADGTTTTEIFCQKEDVSGCGKDVTGRCFQSP